VFYKPMRRRRWTRIEAGQAPPTWKTFPMHDKGARGSAKPGRGGRRKRRRRAAADRAYSMLDVLPPGAQANEATMRFFRLRPSRFPSLLGRRERRRRAKLRRRRARAEREGRRPSHQIKRTLRSWKRLPFTPGLWRSLAMSWMLKREAQHLRDMLLPGA